MELLANGLLFPKMRGMQAWIREQADDYCQPEDTHGKVLQWTNSWACKGFIVHFSVEQIAETAFLAMSHPAWCKAKKMDDANALICATVIGSYGSRDVLVPRKTMQRTSWQLTAKTRVEESASLSFS